MSTGDESTPDTPRTAEPVDPQAGVTVVAEAARHSVEAVADALGGLADEAAALSGEAVGQVGSANAAGVSDTAKAFEEARDRLQKADDLGADGGGAIMERFRAGTELLSQRMPGNLGRASQSIAAFNTKAIEAWRTNAEAAIAHWQRLAGVTSWSEIITLNSAHARAQIDIMTAQTRELAELAGQIAREGSDAMKEMKPPRFP